MAIERGFSIGDALDKAKVIHSLPSDYKLALIMDIQPTTLTNYRQGKTLPDARVIGKICALTGDDPALMAAEIEALRAKTDEARALWLQVVERLQSTLHAVILSIVFGALGLTAFPRESAAKTAESVSSAVYTSWNIAQGFTRHLHRLKRLALGMLTRFFGSSYRVPGTASTAAA